MASVHARLPFIIRFGDSAIEDTDCQNKSDKVFLVNSFCDNRKRALTILQKLFTVFTLDATGSQSLEACQVVMEQESTATRGQCKPIRPL
ncbi:hypothetical protein J6590_092566, partial [Homalodisca vitripennis]